MAISPESKNCCLSHLYKKTEQSWYVGLPVRNNACTEFNTQTPVRAHIYSVLQLVLLLQLLVLSVGSPRGGDVAVYVFGITFELVHSFFPSSCVCFSLYGPFSCISFHKFSQHSLVSHSVLPVSFLPYWSFQLRISFESLHQP